MSLITGRRIHRRNWTPLPIPDEVVSRVEQLGRKDGQPNLLVFTNKHGEILLDGDLENLDDDDLSYATEVGSDEIPGVDSDLSAMSDVPDEDLLNPNVEVQQNTGGLQEDAEMETIQEEGEGQVSADEDIQGSEIVNTKQIFTTKTSI